MDMQHLQQGLILYIILAASIALHEYGHAKAADLLGDPLPRMQGRVTLNPLAHLDPIGTVLIPLVVILLSPAIAIFGWGRPVELSLSNPRTRIRDEVLATIAGPGMNFVIAGGTMLVGAVLMRAAPGVGRNFLPLFEMIIVVNAMLIVFNLIPLPPLDGSRLLRHIVGMREATFAMLAANSWWVLLILINLPAFRTFIWNITSRLATPIVNLMVKLGGFTYG